jgi:hypothetical protein
MSSNPVTRTRNAANQKANPKLDEIAERIRTRAKSAFDGVIEIGRDLIAAKKIIGHGKWLPWLEREFAWDESSARRFMAIAEAVGKSPKLSDLNVPVSGLYLLIAHTTPAEVIEAVAERSEQGDKLTLAEVKRMIADALEPKRRYVMTTVNHAAGRNIPRADRRAAMAKTSLLLCPRFNRDGRLFYP